VQNFQNELQMLGLDHYRVGSVIPIDHRQYMQDSRIFGFGCGGFRRGGCCRCGGGFGCFGCFGFGMACFGFGIGFI
jgi:heterocycloanthracin/sonorensin family bacteriocin